MGSLSQRQHNKPVERVTEAIETPLLDDRLYRVIKLPNGLEVLLVHDAGTDKASAAMDVNVGALSDPEDMPGLAHAVEHMLFMGTRKYPIENEYKQYLANRSGSSNAYTSATSTNYYFEVAAKTGEDADPDEPSPFYGALDRFAQFFIEPLFLPDTLGRELQIVDAENQKNMESDDWRMYQLKKTLSNPKHPYCHFFTGNLKVLKLEPEARGVDVRKEFMEFHEKHYSANLMKLVVLGRESLDTLQSWTADLFAGVPNKNLPQNRWENEVPYRPDELLTQCFAKPAMDLRFLDLLFPFINEDLLFESPPSGYICPLIRHKGPGSIMAYIKSKCWANGLEVYIEPVCPGTPSIFHCKIQLTEDGLTHYKEIVKAFFQYISLLKEAPPQQWIFDEQKGIAEMDFKFKQKIEASEFTSLTSSVMQTPLPREWLLRPSRTPLLTNLFPMRKFDTAGIEEGLACLRPDNFRMTVASQRFPGVWGKKEKWYGTEYTYEKIPADFLNEIKQAASSTSKNRLPELHLPYVNQFIPANLEVEKKEVAEPAVEPKVIRNDDATRVWFKKDDTFWVPKANVYATCRNTLPDATAENSLKTRLYTDMVLDALKEYLYDAELVGLEYSITSHSKGLEISVSYYNDKLPVLLEKVLLTMRDIEISPSRFEIIKERLHRDLRNWEYKPPNHQAWILMQWLTRDKAYLNEQTLAELPHLTATDIQQFFPQVLRQMHIETFVHGNLHEEDALKLGNLIESTLKPRVLPETQWPIPRSLVFPAGSNYVYRKTLQNPVNKNHCIAYLLYIGDRAPGPLRAKTLLLEHMTCHPVYNQLRTKENLAYLLWSGASFMATTMYFWFIVQSDRDLQHLGDRIDSFLSGYAEIMANMTEVEFEKHKRSLITERSKKLENLNQESKRLWGHIAGEYFAFDLVHQDTVHIEALTKAGMVEFYSHFILPASPARSKLAIHLNAQGSSEIQGLADGTAAAENGMNFLDLKDGHKSEVTLVKEEINGTTPYGVTDLREFKSRLQNSAGPQPVKHISKFEEPPL